MPQAQAWTPMYHSYRIVIGHLVSVNDRTHTITHTTRLFRFRYTSFHLQEVRGERPARKRAGYWCAEPVFTGGSVARVGGLCAGSPGICKRPARKRAGYWCAKPVFTGGSVARVGGLCTGSPTLQRTVVPPAETRVRTTILNPISCYTIYKFNQHFKNRGLLATNYGHY